MQNRVPGRTGLLALLTLAGLILFQAVIGAQGSIALTAAPVDALPRLDGAASDPCWETAAPAEIGPFVVKAVYTDQELCLLCTYEAPSLSRSAVTADAVASGRAIAGPSRLSDQALAEIWAAYQHLRTSLPGLVPADSSGVQVGVSISRGTWTVELARPLVTGIPADLQFTDVDQGYTFEAAGSQVLLAFAPEGPGLAEGYEEEQRTGCFCRTTM